MTAVTVHAAGPALDHGSADGRIVASVLDALKGRAQVRMHPTGDGRRGVLPSLLQLTRSGLAGGGLLLRPPGHMPRLYLPLTGSVDLDAALMLASAARLRGYRLFVHHVRGHAAGRWLDQREPRVAWLDRVAGPGTVHVLPSEEQVSRLRWVYRTQRTAVAAPRPVELAPEAPLPPRPQRPWTMGLVLDIGPDPAVTDAMNAFALTSERLGDCRLIVAGAPVRQTHRRHIEDAVERYRGHVTLTGPVTVERWREVCRELDVLLLPARETDDSWPPAVIEAMAAGVPVIARAAGCMRSLIGEPGGSVIDTTADIPRKTLRLVQSWQHDPAIHADARRRAAHRGRHVADLTRKQFAAFLDLIAPLP